jgi:hypothetical protein
MKSRPLARWPRPPAAVACRRNARCPIGSRRGPGPAAALGPLAWVVGLERGPEAYSAGHGHWAVHALRGHLVGAQEDLPGAVVHRAGEVTRCCGVVVGGEGGRAPPDQPRKPLPPSASPRSSKTSMSQELPGCRWARTAVVRGGDGDLVDAARDLDWQADEVGGTRLQVAGDGAGHLGAVGRVPLCPSSSESRAPWLVEGSVAEHGEEDADAVAGEAEEGLGVGFAAGSAAVVVAAGGGICRAANAERNIARFSCRFPPLGACSPWMEVPDCRVAGASPA